MKKFFGGSGSDRPAVAPAPLTSGSASSGAPHHNGGLAFPSNAGGAVSAAGGHGSKLSIGSMGGHGLQAPSTSAHSQDTSFQSQATRSRLASQPTTPSAGFLPNASQQDAQYFDRSFNGSNSGFLGRPTSSSSLGVGGGQASAAMGYVNLPNGSGFLGGASVGPPSPIYMDSAALAGGGGVTPPISYANQPGGLPAAQGPSGAGTNFDRNELHKSLKALENLLISLDEYRELAAKMAKVEKRVAKAANELAKGKMTREIPAQTLSASAFLFGALEDVSAKHSKYIQKEYETVNDQCAKYFKRVAKEEKAYEDNLDSLDSKVKKAHASHEKNVKRSGTKAIESHDKYISSVSQLTNEIGQLKAAHGASLGGKGHVINLAVASCIAGMADAEFRTHCERVRAAGPVVGKINELLNFAVSEAMPAIQPTDLQEDALGPAAVLAAAQAHVEIQAAQRRAVEEQAKETAQLEWAARQMGWVPPDEQLQLDQHQQSQQRASAEKRPPPAASSAPANAAPAARGSATAATGSDGNLSRSASLSSQQRGLLPKLDSNGELVKEEETPVVADTSVSRKSAEATKSPSVVAPATNSTKSSSAPSSSARSAAPPAPAITAMVDDSTEQQHLRGQNSSVAEGTIIETRLQASQDSDTPLPSLTNSSSRVGSDEPILRTPRDVGSVADDPLSKKNAAGFAYSNGGILGTFGFERPGADPSGARPAAANAAEVRSRDSENRPSTELPHSAADKDDVDSGKPAGPAAPEPQPEPMAVQSADKPYRQPVGETAIVNARNQEPANDLTPRGTLNRPSQDAPQAYESRGPAHPALRGEGERYGPTISSLPNRAEGPAHNRHMSTDSERSFVAKMKARYQAEKQGMNTAPMAEESAYDAPHWSRDHPSPAEGRAVSYGAPPPARATPPPASGPRYSEPPRRSYDQGGHDDAYRYSQQQAPSRGYDDRYGPARDWEAPPRRPYDSMPPASPNKASHALRGGPPPSEFGSVRSDRAPHPASVTAGYASRGQERESAAPRPVLEEDDDAPHSDVCGCAKCSAKHYGSGFKSGTAARQSMDSYRPQGDDRYADARHYDARALPAASAMYGRARPPPASSAAGRAPPGRGGPPSGGYHDPRDANTRRQSLPPPRAGNAVPSAAAPVPGRASPYHEYDYGSGHYEDDRRVAFASTTETIR